MTIFEYREARPFLRDWIRAQPRHGRGLLGTWARALRVHPTLLSQVLSGKRALTPELAEGIGAQLALGESELDYLHDLAALELAGTEALRQRLARKLEEAQARARRIAERVKVKHELSEADRAEFYSSWHYSGIRNLTAVPGYNDVAALAARLGVPRPLVQSMIEFLLQAGLCVKAEDGRLAPGPQRTYISPQSPLVQKHHQNWRLHGFSKMVLRREEDLFLTFPMSLSLKDAARLRTLLPAWVEEVNGIVGPSPSETVRCLNIDFFEY